MHKLRAQDPKFLFVGRRDRFLVSGSIVALVAIFFRHRLPKMADRADTEIFDGGRRSGWRVPGLIKPNQRRSVQRALLAVLIVWAPLFVLSAIESLGLEENKLGSLIGDLTVLSRYLIVVPLFILAEAGTIFRLGQITRHFIDAGIITAADRPRFDGILAQAQRLLNSVLVEVLVVALAYLAMIILIRPFRSRHSAGITGDGGRGYSQADGGTR
jgi:hypothetical protein